MMISFMANYYIKLHSSASRQLILFINVLTIRDAIDQNLPVGIINTEKDSESPDADSPLVRTPVQFANSGQPGTVLQIVNGLREA